MVGNVGQETGVHLELIGSVAARSLEKEAKFFQFLSHLVKILASSLFSWHDRRNCLNKRFLAKGTGNGNRV
jgi:hypothetical protein